MTYDPSVKVPADAKAVVVAPSVVGDRYIQLTPVYKSGPVLQDGARLDSSRTAVPLELDQVYADLDQLAVALGPKGANKSGSLSRLLTSTARNFGGQGAQFNTTMHNLSEFTSTLDDNKEALFGASAQIERFVSALSKNDQTVRSFNDSLSSASTVLAGERADLAAALHNLGIAMQDVSGFVKENKDALSKNITGLVKLTDILVKLRAALDETLKDAPVALANLYHTYNPRSGTLDTRANLGENINYLTTDPIKTVCEMVSTTPAGKQLCDQLKNGGAGRAAPGQGPVHTGHGHGVVVVEPIDTSLAGIVGRQR
jgi:phospholipid/cholesterol/gamma-HCH transport system substrate-binding protein